ncbi:unnamed protein product [Rotaria magnacalcarata]|uniref:U2A'/phosphoprotein 32 family A C-terminal domain-containing protein n=3 Tax=Rotaria magnacalcarata TaxID=392030 RepID=A0A816WZ43_9BILA|nr:unnamed protein product [Rotaria magnacalcarata]CAF1668050.1 unnamed protein product [Rotaria magnacalcarata]CAF1957019.1 unnamed protein product [Rotaria magnacalcarata]CAF2140133.1 unnamed protein product [Rotaria magnacalcarata]CAF2140218.1 unnamed protein product [Rotaria magnacalcarata]
MSEPTMQDENSVTTEQNSMVQRIALEVKRREPSSINELVLDNCARCYSIQGLTVEFCNLRVLSIINVGLQSLAKFPALPKLRKLYLSDNRLSSGLENLEGCPNLTLLILAGNKFKSIDELKPLTKLPKLSILDLMNCEVTSVDGYRETMFNMLPQLKYLDNADRSGVEKDSDDEDDDEDELEEDNENGGSDGEDDEEDDEEYEEDDNKTGLKALYNGTFEEGDDDDEESYEGNSDEEEEESDEDDDLSEGDVSAESIEKPSKGEKRKRGTDDRQENAIETNKNDDDSPPHKI